MGVKRMGLLVLAMSDAGASDTSEKIQRICSHLALFNPNNEAMYAATVATVQQNTRASNGKHDMVADSPSSGLQETLEQNVAYGTVDSEKHPDATVPHASQMHEKPKTGKCNNGHDNATTKGWGQPAAFCALAAFLCTLFNALQVNDRSHFVCGKGMHWHSNMDSAVRLIISSSDAPATLHWRDGPGATRAQQVDIEYGSGTTFCLVYNVKSSLFGHKIQHCPESYTPYQVLCNSNLYFAVQKVLVNCLQ